MRFTLLSILFLFLFLPSYVAEVHTIYIVDYAFEAPDGSTDIQIPIGDTIIFQWNSTDTHNVAQIENEEDDSRLESGFYSGEPVSGSLNWSLPQEYTNSNITGNITSKNASLGGLVKGNVNSDQINIKKTANIEGVLNQKTLSIEEGAVLKVKTETYK